jgi:AraC-like DNA-binding protein
MLVLDTKAIAPADRAEAFQSTVSLNCTTSMASFEDPDALEAEMHVYDLGQAKVFNIDATGTTLRRTPQMARAMNDCPIALALPMRTTNHLTWDREDRFYDAQDLMVVDLSAPYVYGWSGAGASYAFHVELDDLDLPMDVVHRAAREPRRSPIYPLVRDHVQHVMTDAHNLVESVAVEQVAAASVELMRALIVSAAGDEQRTGEAMHESMGARVQAYVRHHISEPDLTPARIAAANGISLRALYKLYESLGVSLEQSIIKQRLRGARRDLAATGLRHRSIAAVAREWGFANPSFFATRFRQAYGVTPRQWRASQVADDEQPRRRVPGQRAG